MNPWEILDALEPKCSSDWRCLERASKDALQTMQRLRPDLTIPPTGSDAAIRMLTDNVHVGRWVARRSTFYENQARAEPSLADLITLLTLGVVRDQSTGQMNYVGIPDLSLAAAS